MKPQFVYEALNTNCVMKFNIFPLNRKGQGNIMGLASVMMIGIAVAVLAMVFGLILPILNQQAIGTTPYTLLTYLPTIIISFVFVAIVMLAMGTIFRK